MGFVVSTLYINKCIIVIIKIVLYLSELGVKAWDREQMWDEIKRVEQMEAKRAF